MALQCRMLHRINFSVDTCQRYKVAEHSKKSASCFRCSLGLSQRAEDTGATEHSRILSLLTVLVEQAGELVVSAQLGVNLMNILVLKALQLGDQLGDDQSVQLLRHQVKERRAIAEGRLHAALQVSMM